MAGEDIGPASAFAPQVKRVTLVRSNVATAARAEYAAANTDPNSLVVDGHDADSFSFAESQFDLVLYHQCVNTLSDPNKYLQDTGRILKPQGLLAVTTYLVPGTRLRGKKARRLLEAGEYINAWCQLRDSQHRRFYSQNGWEDLLLANSFEIVNQETASNRFDFDWWVDRTSPNEYDRLRLKAMVIQAPEKAREFLTPQFSGDRIRFHLPEITILATLQVNKGRRGGYNPKAVRVRMIE
jgi:SAM-dependent methyltransferase